jgi:hypothetical protein
MKNNVKQSLLVGFFLLGALRIAQAQQTGATEKAIAAHSTSFLARASLTPPPC